MAASVTEIPTMSTEADIILALREELDRSGLSQTAAAREIGVSGSALSQYMGGKYKGDRASLGRSIETWLHARAERRRTVGDMPAAPEWVETPAGARVIGALGYAQMAGDMAVIYGGAGVGKTAACLRYADTAPSVWVVTMSPATASAATALEEIAETLGLRDPGSGAARLQRAIIRRLRGTSGLLVIDEAQHLGVQALDAVRALHDATGVGVALVGNDTVYARMTGGTRAAYLDRLYSRLGKRVRIARATDGDVNAILTAWGVEGTELRGLARRIGAKPGALRGLTKVLRLASMFAAGEPLTAAHVKAAWTDLGGDQ